MTSVLASCMATAPCIAVVFRIFSTRNGQRETYLRQDFALMLDALSCLMQIAVGDYFSCVRFDNHSVSCLPFTTGFACNASYIVVCRGNDCFVRLLFDSALARLRLLSHSASGSTTCVLLSSWALVCAAMAANSRTISVRSPVSSLFTDGSFTQCEPPRGAFVSVFSGTVHSVSMPDELCFEMLLQCAIDTSSLLHCWGCSQCAGACSPLPCQIPSSLKRTKVKSAALGYDFTWFEMCFN